jgi:hypothetical protein
MPGVRVSQSNKSCFELEEARRQLNFNENQSASCPKP